MRANLVPLVGSSFYKIGAIEVNRFSQKEKRSLSVVLLEYVQDFARVCIGGSFVERERDDFSASDVGSRARFGQVLGIDGLLFDHLARDFAGSRFHNAFFAERKCVDGAESYDAHAAWNW